jgi:hypothetical protein
MSWRPQRRPAAGEDQAHDPLRTSSEVETGPDATLGIRAPHSVPPTPDAPTVGAALVTGRARIARRAQGRGDKGADAREDLSPGIIGRCPLSTSLQRIEPKVWSPAPRTGRAR